MIKQSFEIKIALLGYVSVGKTTVLNALLRDKYGEVSMRRTTAGINYFCLSFRRGGGETRNADAALSDDVDDEQNSSSTAGSGPIDWSVVNDGVRTAEETLKEITLDNASLRESDVVQAKTFDVELEQEICETRSDTKVVLVDIPGLNEAGASTKYKDYVSQNWHTFDCAIVVMDAKQGVNTEDQLELLRFVKENLKSKKDVPTIILANKVDEPDDHEQSVLVSEIRSAVETIFEAPNREEALEQIVAANSSSSDSAQSKEFPVFIPVSAIHAYIYQTASLMNFEKFQNFDKELIERLGREVVGTRTWRRCSVEQKYKQAYEVVTDPALYKQGIEDINFNKVVSALSHCVGGEETQRKLIAKQLQVSRSLLSYDSCIVRQLQGMSEKVRLLGEPVEELKVAFWRVFEDLEAVVAQEYKGPTTIHVLSKPMGELIEYYSWAGQMGWNDEQTLANDKMKELFRSLMETVFREATSWLSKAKKSEQASTKKHTKKRKGKGKNVHLGKSMAEKSPSSFDWTDLTAADWISILDSLLLLSFSRSFCESFGREKLFIEMLKAQLISQNFPVTDVDTSICYGSDCIGFSCKLDEYNYCEKCGTSWRMHGEDLCPRCVSSGHGDYKLDRNGCCEHYCETTFETFPPQFSKSFQYENGEFVVKDEKVFRRFMKLDIPDSLSDPSHFGHLGWKYCSLLESAGRAHH